MTGFKIPIDFSKGDFYNSNLVENDKNDDSKSILKSIDDFITLLINSPNGSFKPDSRFGFLLKNRRFENVDSNDEIQGRKIGGGSDDNNYYATCLKEAIERFETRLEKDLKEVTIGFNNEHHPQRNIHIEGKLKDINKEYKKDISFYIWKDK